MKFRLLPKFFLAAATAIILLLPAAGAFAAAPGAVRVALVRQADVLDFRTGGNYSLVDQSTGKIVATLGQGENWQVYRREGRIEMQGQKGRYGPFNGPVMVREATLLNLVILDGSGEKVERSSSGGLEVLNGDGRTASLSVNPRLRTAGSTADLAGSGSGKINLLTLKDSTGSKRYRGNLEFVVESGGLAAINELTIEDYLRGVVPAEMPSSWPAEALKAQAVAARNFALQQVETTRGGSFHVTNNESSQVYGGYDAEAPATNRAIEETRGVVMLSRGSLIMAVFHSSSGGFIENSEDVWLNKLPYITYKNDPYDKNDKHYKWCVTYTAEQLAEQFRKAGYDFEIVQDIEERARTTSGARVEKIAVKGEGPAGERMTVEISNADNVRIALGLKSALFTLEKIFDQDKNLAAVKITGSGWGHGLGMSQWGANGMASQGYAYQDILKYYYSGINLVGGYGRAASVSQSSPGEGHSISWLQGD